MLLEASLSMKGGWKFRVNCIITLAIKPIKCHAGPRIKSGAGFDPASSPFLDSRFRWNDDFDIYFCRSNEQSAYR
ncbi:MAG: hypothetical protein D4R56_01860 [Deltaproteobacteria bacterium]|nr:MAG: hypothetical protein D4R56_01860 [Deltaproteobacteria bacterium]